MIMVLEAWLKWLRVGKDLWEVLGSTPNVDKKIYLSTKKKKNLYDYVIRKGEKKIVSLYTYQKKK